MAKTFKPAATTRPATPVPAPTPAAAAPVSRTDVRNSPLPKTNPTASSASSSTGKKQVTQEQIARRAYEIWQSGKGGSDFENWVRAERELRGS